jgi:hypothetical protein
MATAARSRRFGEYNYRCACIAQLVEQLTLKDRHAVDLTGRLRTNSQLTPISRLTRSLQIRRHLNLARDFRFVCIPGMSIESKEFHSGGYNGGYRKWGGNLGLSCPLVAPSARSPRTFHRR